LTMASLTESAFYTRKLIKWGAILVTVILMFRYAANIAGFTWRKLNPPKPAQPTVAFGKLPKIVFPERNNLPDLTFELGTIEGTLPTITNVVKVYFMSKEIYTFLTLENAKSKAEYLGFPGDPEEISETGTSYQWRIGDAIPSFLTMEIINQSFNIRYSYEKDQSLLNIKTLITPDQALVETRTFLKKADFLPKDIQNGQANFIYYRYSPLELIKVTSLSETDFIKVNLLREDIEKMIILPPNPYDANISALVSKSSGKRIVELKYSYFPIDIEVWATYPIIDSSFAWNQLKSGKGFIANLGDNQEGKIIIRKVYLAYYDSPIHQNFLQPVFVFEGDKQFISYVPAVTGQYIQE